jgi:Protein kinase domain
MEANTPQPSPRNTDPRMSLGKTSPPHKKLKTTPMKTPRPGGFGNPPETPKVLANAACHAHGDGDVAYNKSKTDDSSGCGDDSKLPMTPVPDIFRRRSISSSSPSDLSQSSRRDGSLSPGTPYVPEIPPAPPSTPASDFKSTLSSSHMDGLSTPLPYAAAVKNAAQLEREQQFADGAATPAPTKSASNRTDLNESSRTGSLIDDFTGWIVGDRYKLVRMLGRGSYGEVAQALDLHRANASVAIKRIQSPFDQEVDAVRLFREIHILRRLKGHECIIDLLDIVQPPSEDLDQFNDLYLVFECKSCRARALPSM